MSIGEGFHVEPEDLGTAGSSATEIGHRAPRDRGTKTALASLADGESYEVLDLRDGQHFEIAGISFQIAIFPDRDEVIVCQPTADPATRR